MTKKDKFRQQLKTFATTLVTHISGEDAQWTIKGFIDAYKNIYTISSDTKIVSKILEIHLFPKLTEFAQQHGYKIVLPKHQNYYPDISFIKIDNSRVKFAVDIKTTYRNSNKPHLCNGLTLGSHGKYFTNRQSTKNIQFPYASYTGHFCLGIIYDRIPLPSNNAEKIYAMKDLKSITSVIKDLQFFVGEKWRIASDKSGSGNTANIGSINNINDIINENGMFSKLGEKWFDEYWMNYKKISVTERGGKTKKISTLKEFVEYKGGDTSLIVPKNNKGRIS